MHSDWNSFFVPHNADLYNSPRAIQYADNTDPFRSLYLCAPKERADGPAILWFHGGGLTGGGREIPDLLYNGQNIILEARYRLSPAIRADETIADAAAAAAWAFRHIGEYGGNPKKLFVSGMSAGAYLAAMIGMSPDYLKPYGFGPEDFAGVLPISGQMTTHFRVKHDLGYHQTQYQPVIDRLAPLYWVRAELPPILLITGESGLDMAGRPEENALMAASLRAVGHRKAEHNALSGHDHSGTLDSAAYLMNKFIGEVLATK